MINRRGFLGRLAALIAAPFVPLPAAPAPAPLAFHSKAFVMAFDAVPLHRLDVLYGFASLSPQFAFRTESEPFRATDNYRAYLERDAAIQSEVGR